MLTARALVASDPRQFGRGAEWQLVDEDEPLWTMSGDLKLFGSTFVAGFLFVSILIA